MLLFEVYIIYCLFSFFFELKETYEELWKWSVNHYVDFWEMFWKYSDIVHTQPYEKVLQLPVFHYDFIIHFWYL